MTTVQRRQRRRRGGVLKVILFVCSLVSVLLMSVGSPAYATDCAKTAVISAEQATLYRVAVNNGLTEAQIKALNPGINPSTLHLGDTVCVQAADASAPATTTAPTPVSASAETPSTTQPPQPPPAASPPAAPSNGCPNGTNTYRVEPGDTWYGLDRDNGQASGTQQTFNPQVTMLYVGATICIKAGTQTAPAAPTSQTSDPSKQLESPFVCGPLLDNDLPNGSHTRAWRLCWPGDDLSRAITFLGLSSWEDLVARSGYNHFPSGTVIYASTPGDGGKVIHVDFGSRNPTDASPGDEPRQPTETIMASVSSLDARKDYAELVEQAAVKRYDLTASGPAVLLPALDLISTLYINKMNELIQMGWRDISYDPPSAAVQVIQGMIQQRYNLETILAAANEVLLEVSEYNDKFGMVDEIDQRIKDHIQQRWTQDLNHIDAFKGWPTIALMQEALYGLQYINWNHPSHQSVVNAHVARLIEWIDRALETGEFEPLNLPIIVDGEALVAVDWEDIQIQSSVGPINPTPNFCNGDPTKGQTNSCSVDDASDTADTCGPGIASCSGQADQDATVGNCAGYMMCEVVDIAATGACGSSDQAITMCGPSNPELTNICSSGSYVQAKCNPFNGGGDMPGNYELGLGSVLFTPPSQWYPPKEKTHAPPAQP